MAKIKGTPVAVATGSGYCIPAFCKEEAQEEGTELPNVTTTIGKVKIEVTDGDFAGDLTFL